jgi:hypothetical protein
MHLEVQWGTYLLLVPSSSLCHDTYSLTPARKIHWAPRFSWSDFGTYLAQENDRQYACNISLRRFTVTIVALQYYECFSVLGCKSYLFCVVLYCHFLPVWFYHIFPHRLINNKIFRNRTIEYKVYGSICSTNLSEIFLILRRIEEDITINWHQASCQ